MTGVSMDWEDKALGPLCEDWGAVRERLEEKGRDLAWWAQWACSMYGSGPEAGVAAQVAADIRAALERVEELERERDAAWVVRDAGWVQTEDALTRMRAAEAEVERLRSSIASYQAAAHNYVNEHGEVARLRSVPDGLQRPDADFLRSLPGDQVVEDRYWIGWTDALDQVSAALRGGGE